jgi:hypothetical protein
MKITLKKFKFFESLSEETNAFTADVYAGKEKIGHAKNTGNGGSTTIYFENRALRDEAEAYCATLPQLVPGYKMGLEDLVDKLAEAMINEKEIKAALRKLDRDAKKFIVVVYKEQLESFKAGKSAELKWRLFELPQLPGKYTDDQQKKVLVSKISLKEGEVIYNPGW